MHPANCLNCYQPLATGQSYCAHCGQKAAIHRITLAHFFHEGFHAFTHADKGIFHLLKQLALQPGTVAREYMAGQRKKYFNPFTFFLLVMAVFVLSNSIFTKTGPILEPDPAILARIPSEAGRQQYIATIGRAATASGFMSKHGNLVAMIALPFISGITWLFFRRKGYNYAEHLTANMLFIAFNNLFFGLLIFPLQSLLRGTPGYFYIVLAGLLLHALYLMWGMNGFLLLRTTGLRLRSFGVSLLAIGGWALFSLLMVSLYISQSWYFYRYFLRMFGH
ncbi:MAG: DUF3667 domain-containing protein [Candidatus Pseudobacter hemicellulosilyticus]|uniref:DUF3667 domain-containing protein n=1 Tax=Candidatus Pseudobacter hemicellulosilyticus TaxID=3121375 RepID=A0AAJ6BJP6_9BACT|nr:MAG: DUF3667 domain-containing protein [Pseudobacter sp.]